jgi:type I restriction enzyme M protein
VILDQPKDGKLGHALTAAMEAVEEHFPPLAGQLPKDYEKFDDELLESMMRKFDTEALRTASGDVFGRIYKYFLAEFSKQGAHDNGEFFTPPSIVQTIVKPASTGPEGFRCWLMAPYTRRAHRSLARSRTEL